jgi:hypothetical protein
MATITEAATGVTRKCEVETDTSDPNNQMILVKFFDENDVELGTPFRASILDSRLRSDLPGVNGDYFHIESGTDHIEVANI